MVHCSGRALRSRGSAAQRNLLARVRNPESQHFGTVGVVAVHPDVAWVTSVASATLLTTDENSAARGPDRPAARKAFAVICWPTPLALRQGRSR
jgi:hypothetical protein